MNHEIDATCYSPEPLLRKIPNVLTNRKVSSGNIWQPRIFGRPQAQLEVEGLRMPRVQGKELMGKKNTPGYEPMKHSLPEGPNQCVVRVSSQAVKVRSRPRPKFKVTDSEAQVLSCNVSSLYSSEPEQKILRAGQLNESSGAESCAGPSPPCSLVRMSAS